MVDECLVTHLNWIQMNSSQQKSRIEKAQKAKVHKDSCGALTASSSTQLSKCLSIKLEDAQISHVNKEKLKSMWEKAEELLSGDGFVLLAAGAMHGNSSTSCEFIWVYLRNCRHTS